MRLGIINPRIFKEETKRYYNAVAERYHPLYEDEISRSENECVAKLLKNHLNISQEAKVLDLGCGDGLGLELLNTDNYTGIDLASKMVELAKEKHKKGRFLEGDMERLEFRKESLDYVISLFGSFSHSSCPDEVVREIARVLKPGGKILIMAYSRFALGHMVRCVLTFKRDNLGEVRCYTIRNQAGPEPKPISAYFYTASSLAKLFSSHFKDLEVYGLNVGLELPLLKTIFRRNRYASKILSLEFSLFGKVLANLAHSLILVGEK